MVRNEKHFTLNTFVRWSRGLAVFFYTMLCVGVHQGEVLFEFIKPGSHLGALGALIMHRDKFAVNKSTTVSHNNQ